MFQSYGSQRPSVSVGRKRRILPSTAQLTCLAPSGGKPRSLWNSCAADWMQILALSSEAVLRFTYGAREHFGNLDTESVAKLHHNVQRRVSKPPLNMRDVGRRDARFFEEMPLRPSEFFPPGAQSFAEQLRMWKPSIDDVFVTWHLPR